MEYRIEHDSMGEVKVPAERCWGAQTQRSFENFRIGTERMPAEIVRAFALLKKAAALANRKLGRLDEDRCRRIAAACDEIRLFDNVVMPGTYILAAVRYCSALSGSKSDCGTSRTLSVAHPTKTLPSGGVVAVSIGS